MWTSLVCTLFLLIICLTGLPLIFAEQINDLANPTMEYAAVPPGTPNESLDRLIDKAKHVYPGEIITSIFADDDEPEVYIWMAPSFASVKANPGLAHFVRFDAHSGHIIERSGPGQRDQTLTGFLFRLHSDLFAGLPGELLLGTMGLLFVTAIVSGVVLYGPFTRRLDFGIVRTGRSRRLRWLDLHNLLGVVTLAWTVIVGVTGTVNELSTPLFALWQQTDVAAMLAPWQGKPPPRPDQLFSAQAALDLASKALPGTVVTSIVFPGDDDGTPYHYLLWAHGSTPLTSRLFSPVLIDARTGKLTAIVRMPWNLRTLEVSRPLHFGDYGGTPLKVIWALLDLVTIVVLASGLYLWAAKRKRTLAVTQRDPHAPAPPLDLLEAAE
ncbi:PepSY-associated TM helix domain-containing protein [Sphingomonas abietis]|uniref:PepSY-associated TM helix domain-containing protein n=1 Tax=Sphingomonas abietis TaxID=3012344 RepID=A0ABY7NQR9_9SPHN|nr:PepSY-associated TM helix domain-containing protein [Sphingomonas abietis]WBO23892.1 PepSY-associated TM helix domain-containing protein [Sphingomonas abietis]